MKEGDEQICAYCQCHFNAGINDIVGQTATVNTEEETEEVDVYWCGCPEGESVVL